MARFAGLRKTMEEALAVLTPEEIARHREERDLRAREQLAGPQFKTVADGHCKRGSGDRRCPNPCATVPCTDCGAVGDDYLCSEHTLDFHCEHCWARINLQRGEIEAAHVADILAERGMARLTLADSNQTATFGAGAGRE
jgi:hypothetical protein